METRKVLSSLCYFSIFFAGFIFPLAVYLATGDEGTKRHAKKSLLSHLIPLILTPLLVLAVFYDFTSQQDAIPVFTVISIIALSLLWLAVVIWNIVKGVKVLTAE
ncbi:hypothetical protein COJ85_15985 [Bacillus sp. AFS076308]|uniref:DUF4870 domain-containing protein n=1 Tax=unclassified Bacillus (in: firmicutes) TaxID=185979 RepID=UPI000BF9613E|nr:MULTISPECIES: DUF4870 domain-containing protein [unclassified Bacillus (in: firmicutes)]PFO02680.1 hypothetical protein COJ85_15985 [Bacillus sp. AFS076308]PGV51485.1 hypothetical protein COD92_13380 [Bacillus sp. AFS037270]